MIKHCPAAIGRSPLENGVLAAKEAVDLRPNEGASPFDGLSLYRIRRTPSGPRDSGWIPNVFSRPPDLFQTAFEPWFELR